jgi:hypothetical protein
MVEKERQEQRGSKGEGVEVAEKAEGAKIAENAT